MAERHETEHKGFAQPDETREFPNGRVLIDWYGASNYAKGG